MAYVIDREVTFRQEARHAEQDRASASLALRRNEERLRLMADALPVLISYVDTERRYQFNNAAYERWFGVPRQACLGRHVSEVVGTEAYRLIETHVSEALAGRPQSYEVRMPFRVPRHVHVDCVPDRDANGQVRGFWALIMDVTERKELEREVLEVAALEQRRIGQELHDDVGQELTGLRLLADALAQRVIADSPAGAAQAEKIVQGIGRVSRHVRSLSHGLVPVEVDSEGLRAALEHLALSVGGACDCVCTFEGDDPLTVGDPNVATHMLRIAQEAVSNALRHSQASHVLIALRREPDVLNLRVEDNGVGIFNHLQRDEGLGLRLMRYRAALIGGTLSVDAAARGGTVVSCQVFLERQAWLPP
jgi:PAS domain S-box-containing protein